ncbi:MAG: DUF5362 domain-containing protein [Ruminiclostridium sp.]
MDNQNDFNNSIQNTANYENISQQNNFIINSIIDSLSGWMKFVGIYTIVTGAITCIGVITAAIGIPLIFAGIALTKASSSIKTYKQHSSPYVLNEVFTSMNKYFKIQGIIAIVGIAILVIYIVFLLFVLVISLNGFFRYY